MDTHMLGIFAAVLLALVMIYFAWRGRRRRDEIVDCSALSPCPFCGKHEARLIHEEIMDLWRVRCPRCEAAGPWGMSGPQATKRWDHRIFRVD